MQKLTCKKNGSAQGRICSYKKTLLCISFVTKIRQTPHLNSVKNENTVNKTVYKMLKKFIALNINRNNRFKIYFLCIIS